MGNTENNLTATEPEIVHDPGSVPTPFLVHGEWPTVSFPEDWSDVERQRWLSQQFGLRDLPPAQPAAFYAGDQKLTNDFSWSNYDPTKHVLVHEELFYYFLNQDKEIVSLRKGMRTINKRRRKENAQARRLERRLAQARSRRDQLRLVNEELEGYTSLLENVFSAMTESKDEWRTRYFNAAKQVETLTAEVEKATAELANVRGQLEDERFLSTPLDHIGSTVVNVTSDGSTVVDVIDE